MPSNKSVKARIISQLGFMLNRLRERLWVKPLFMCLLSVATVFIAGQADNLPIAQDVPDVSQDTIETLLSILSASMLVIAMFAVGAMLSAYASASSATTPRAFSVVVADDVSQNALSVYLGAFIFSVVALIALLNDYYDIAGRFSLFLLTIVVFALVIASFVRWMDRIARLGRTGTIIHKVEAATLKSLYKMRQNPTLGARLAEGKAEGQAFYSQDVGYVQRVNLADLQALAEKHQCHFTLAARPGILASPGQPLLFIQGQSGIDDELKTAIENTFVIADSRTFNDDPRFGLIVLSEIASRALSPGINDPGTAIVVIGTLVRLFSRSATIAADTDVLYSRISVPAIAASDMFDDAFNAIARDGASNIEV
ncbi:MAG TPA: DUF2254 domain-containing protein, partial [Cellvibrionaceae bacterium]